MTTNYERWAATPEKAADLIIQFDTNMRCGRPAVRSFERFKEREANRACMRTNPRGMLIDWLNEECE